VTDSASEPDGIWHVFRNSKSDGYLKSITSDSKLLPADLPAAKIIQCISTIVDVTVEVRLNNSTLIDEGLLCFLSFLKTITIISIVHC